MDNVTKLGCTLKSCKSDEVPKICENVQYNHCSKIFTKIGKKSEVGKVLHLKQGKK